MMKPSAVVNGKGSERKGQSCEARKLRGSLRDVARGTTMFYRARMVWHMGENHGIAGDNGVESAGRAAEGDRLWALGPGSIPYI